MLCISMYGNDTLTLKLLVSLLINCQIFFSLVEKLIVCDCEKIVFAKHNKIRRIKNFFISLFFLSKINIFLNNQNNKYYKIFIFLICTDYIVTSVQ